jgi:menaquinol-cytochrome c reductase iron-sulfur subunit
MDDQSFESPQVPGRRTFFKRFVNGLGAAIGAILGVPLAGLYALPAFSTPTRQWKECGAVDDFPVGDIKLVPLKPLEQRQWPEVWGAEAAWVYRKSDQDFVVYNLHCTHVGCPVTWSPQARRFFSPCHGGVFDADGRVLAGPPPRPLDRFDIKIENGVLFAGPAYQVNEQLERLS